VFAVLAGSDYRLLCLSPPAIQQRIRRGDLRRPTAIAQRRHKRLNGLGGVLPCQFANVLYVFWQLWTTTRIAALASGK
jgi:hypothetical protein